jgi:hypothetical protein
MNFQAPDVNFHDHGFFGPVIPVKGIESEME